MTDLFKICIHHGELNKEDIGLHSHTQRKKIRIYCKICQRERDHKKREVIREMRKNNPDSFNKGKIHTCIKHGLLKQNDIYTGTDGLAGCRICKRESNVLSDAKWKNKNPDASRRSNIKKKYGITLEQYQEMLIAQNNVCYICKQPETHGNRGKINPLSVDHCHEADKAGIMFIRKLLCRKCNSALALIREDADIARSMINYIETICNKNPV